MNQTNLNSQIMKSYQSLVEAIFLSAVRENDIIFFKSNWSEELAMFFSYGQKIRDRLKKLDITDSIQKTESDEIPLYKISYKTGISVKKLRPFIKWMEIPIHATENRNRRGYLQSHQDTISKSNLKKLFQLLIKYDL